MQRGRVLGILASARVASASEAGGLALGDFDITNPFWIAIVAGGGLIALCLLLILVCRYGRACLMHFCLGRPFYCCCCFCVECCGCCLGFKRADPDTGSQEKALVKQKLIQAQLQGQPKQKGVMSLFQKSKPTAETVPVPDEMHLPKGVQRAADALASAELETPREKKLCKQLSLSIMQPSASGLTSKASFEAYGLKLGRDHIEYMRTETTDPRRPGQERMTRFKLPLDQVTAVAAMNDPLSWTLFVENGTTYEFRADSQANRQAWVEAICSRLRENDINP